MSVDIERILESKKEIRKELAARPIAEKLRMLDELLRRARTIKRATVIQSAHAEDTRP